MDYRNEILGLASKWASLTGKTRATAALRIVNDGKFFERIEGGGGCTVGTYQKVKEWFKENTPPGDNPNGKHRSIKAP